MLCNVTDRALRSNSRAVRIRPVQISDPRHGPESSRPRAHNLSSANFNPVELTHIQLLYINPVTRYYIAFIIQLLFFNTIFVSNHMYPEKPEETQVILGSMNMGYISDTARNRTHNLFRPKREPIPLGHKDGLAC